MFIGKPLESCELVREFKGRLKPPCQAGFGSSMGLILFIHRQSAPNVLGPRDNREMPL